jgi:hypothetical protein
MGDPHLTLGLWTLTPWHVTISALILLLVFGRPWTR